VQANRVNLVVNNVWNRGDWTLHLADEQVGSGTGTIPGDSNAVALRRDGDKLVIECPLAPNTNLHLTWH
jgi:hypothetical protein